VLLVFIGCRRQLLWLVLVLLVFLSGVCFRMMFRWFIAARRGLGGGMLELRIRVGLVLGVGWQIMVRQRLLILILIRHRGRMVRGVIQLL
jgi:hypothetical protein